MEWIDAIRSRLAALDVSVKTLRQSGIMIGSVLAGISGCLIAKNPAALIPYAIAVVSCLLLSLALMRPMNLSGVYRLWMGAAFAFGGVVSKLFLTGIFFLVVTPIGIAARCGGHHFLEIARISGSATYWVRRSGKRLVNYEKMY